MQEDRCNTCLVCIGWGMAIKYQDHPPGPDSRTPRQYDQYDMWKLISRPRCSSTEWNRSGLEHMPHVIEASCSSLPRRLEAVVGNRQCKSCQVTTLMIMVWATNWMKGLPWIAIAQDLADSRKVAQTHGAPAGTVAHCPAVIHPGPHRCVGRRLQVCTCDIWLPQTRPAICAWSVICRCGPHRAQRLVRPRMCNKTTCHAIKCKNQTTCLA